MVINLGAGFDTRPYRMQLPQQLKWVEVDFQHLIDHKNTRLADEKPVCNLERIAVDLSMRRERKELFARVGAETKNALVITEGVISYLTNAQAEELAKDIFATPSFKLWVMDFAQGRFRKNGQAKKLKKILINTPQQFTDADPINFFRALGWKVVEKIFILDEGDRIGRKIPGMFPWNVLSKVFPKTIRKLGNQTYGYVMFGKGD
jgi:O-methyltransferase involved in polyketide biosynthesis